MKFNKQHKIWTTAPWHVKVSVFAVPSLKALYLYAYSSLFIGLACFLGISALYDLVQFEVLKLLFAGSGLSLACCMYLLAIIWVKDNPACLEQHHEEI